MRSSAGLERLGAVKTRRGSRLRCGKRPNNRMACRGRVGTNAAVKQALRLKRRACTKATFRFEVSGPDVQRFRGRAAPVGPLHARAGLSALDQLDPVAVGVAHEAMRGPSVRPPGR